jgi:hypothetical protein
MFNRTFRHVATFVFALAALAACDATPLAPRAQPAMRSASVLTAPSGTTISRDVATVPVSFVAYVPCANNAQGEVLHLVGTLDYAGHWITTTQGQRQHNLTVSSFAGSATGTETGDVYDAIQREVFQSNTNYGTDGIPDSAEELQRIRLRLTSRATGAVYDVALVGRFVQTATGEFVLEGWDGTARCN